MTEENERLLLDAVISIANNHTQMIALMLERNGLLIETNEVQKKATEEYERKLDSFIKSQNERFSTEKMNALLKLLLKECLEEYIYNLNKEKERRGI